MYFGWPKFTIKPSRLLNQRLVLPGETADEEALMKLINSPDPSACGITGIQSGTGATREVIELLLQALEDNDMRGGVIYDANGNPVGDGAGIMLRTDNDKNGRGMQNYLHGLVGRQVPMTRKGENLHSGMMFIDRTLQPQVAEIGEKIETILKKYGLTALNFRKANIDESAVSPRSKAIMPLIHQLTYAENGLSEQQLQTNLYYARIEIQETIPGINIVSLQPGTMTFKLMGSGHEVKNFYRDLESPEMVSDAGLVHVRFGTNTLANWFRAHPYDLLVHNGEVNSIRKILRVLKNLERMNAIPGTNIAKGGSDSANMDRALQFLRSRGLSLEESARYLIQPPLDDLKRMPPDIQQYFRALSKTMGSLRAIGPIALLGMDRNKIIAAVDNMGLRPLRMVMRDDGLWIIGSEVGIPTIDRKRVVDSKRVNPGELYVKGRDGKLEGSDEVNARIVRNTKLNYKEIVETHSIELTTKDANESRLTKAQETMRLNPETKIKRAHSFGLNTERRRRLLETIRAGEDPVEGMGSDLAIALLSDEPNSMGRYIQANYAQVSNPSLDYKRETGPFTTKTLLGARPEQETFGEKYKAKVQYKLEDPLLDDDQMTALYTDPQTITISSTYNEQSVEACEKRIEEIKDQVLELAAKGEHAIIVLSDRDTDPDSGGYIPPHILAAYLSRELDQAGKSNGVSLVFDTGEVLDQHEFNTLASCGAKAIFPRTIYEEINSGNINFKDKDPKQGLRNAFRNTLLRYMAKIGVTDIDSYRGTEHISTVGLSDEFIRKYFNDEVSANEGGAGLERILQDQWRRGKSDHAKLRESQEKHGYSDSIVLALQKVGGNLVKSPEDLKKLEAITDADSPEMKVMVAEVLQREKALYTAYKTETRKGGALNVRDTFNLKKSGNPIPIEEVMPANEIISLILRGAAISLGSINDMSHRALHLLFNHYNSFANSGEGGVPKDRSIGQPWEDAHCKEIQVASGRFGIDIETLANPQVKIIEIKLGQGAKPGVGGQLPGKKVFPLVASIRGVGLGQETISPTTNHDIYSIEDLQALTDRLRACNPTAEIATKITSGAGVGTIAVGCAKAEAQRVNVSGGAGGTGAATYTDKFNTGLPTEFGVAYSQNELVSQGLRDRVVLGCDGGIRHGEDVLKLMALGADEVSLGTLMLIAQQKCIFCQSCGTQKCPAYITRSVSKFLSSSKDDKTLKQEYASEDEKDQMNRLLYNGMRILEFMAEEMREYLAEMGIKDPRDIIGNRNFLEFNEAFRDKIGDLKLGKFLDTPEPIFQKDPETIIEETTDKPEESKYTPDQIDYYLNSPRVNAANRELIKQVYISIKRGDNPATAEIPDLRPKDRDFGATLGCLIVRGLIKVPNKGIEIRTTGEPGQGFGTGLTHGVTLIHTGQIQNEACEFQNGGKLVVLSPITTTNKADIAGNTLAYGARGGDRFIQGSVGIRDCIRETFGRTIITGNTGKYFAEFKTGGTDIVLGEFGYDVGAGMSGGASVSPIYGLDPELKNKLAKDATMAKLVRKRDLQKIKEGLEEFYGYSKDYDIKQILDDWDNQKHRFQKVVAKSAYETTLFEYLYLKFKEEPYSSDQEETLLADICELCGYDIDEIDPAKLRAIHAILESNLTELKTNILPEGKRARMEDEQQFMTIREFATTAINEIKKLQI